MRKLIAFAALALALLASDVEAASRFWNPYIVTGAVAGTAGVCRLTISPAITGSGLLAGDSTTTTNITGATGCNVTATVSTVVDSTHIELTGTTFGGAYVSGGCVSGGRITSGNTSNWAASSTSTCGSGGSSVPGSADDVTFDANSLTGVIVSNFSGWTTKSITTGAFVGTLDNSVNNDPWTIGGGTLGWSGTGSGTRTIKLGSATYTLNDVNGNIWNWSTTTNLTLNAGTSTILFSAVGLTSRNFICNGAQCAFNAFTVTNASPHADGIFISGSQISFVNLTMTNVRQLTLPGNATTTVSGTLSYSGSGGQYGVLTSNSGGAGTFAATLSVAGAWAPQNLLMQNLIQSGAGSISCNPCVDGGGNTTSGTFTITPASGGGNKII